MKISELATKTQVPAKTIRYYEQIGLLASPSRGSNGYRQYQKENIATLVFIRRCRELNIAISDIKLLIEVQQDPKASCASIDKIIADQLARIQQSQRELAMLEQSLATLASSCKNHQVEDCCILHQLKAG